MDIGTAKPNAEVLQRYPHALVDICDPADAYSAARFVREADVLVAQTLAEGRIPLLVGGTMLYFRSFNQGLAELPDASPEIRQTLSDQAARAGWKSLHEELVRVDPEAARKIHPHNSQRLQRALEVYRTTGKPISWWWQQQTGSSPQDRHNCQYWQFSLGGVPRQDIHRHIESRFKQMLEEGFIQEVEGLRGRGDLSLDMPSMRAVGYRQAWRHLAGEIDYREMQRQAIAATRQLAKRQLTWLRRWDYLIELDSSKEDPSTAILKKLERVPIVQDCTAGE